VLIDDYLPEYHASERHETVIDAPIERVYRLVRQLDLSHSILSPPFRLWRRAARRASPRRDSDGRFGLSLQSFLDYGFVLLAEQPTHEVVIGLTERVGLGEQRVRRIRGEEFKTFNEPGFAKAAWNFSLASVGQRRTRLATETRIYCVDDRSRRRFLIYWYAIRIFSGLIRQRACTWAWAASILKSNGTT
jgi:hypothetical protein